MQVHKSGSSKTYQDSNRNNEGHSTGRISEHFEDDDSPVQTRAVRGRRKPHTGSMMALTNEMESADISYQDPRKRSTASVRHQYHKVDHCMALCQETHESLGLGGEFEYAYQYNTKP